MNIQLLDQDTVNQIAAGEVLERPANLVKELIENSLDAQSTEIEIELDRGGKLLKVTDNGFGIHPSDFELALSRHATSKIKNFSDLWSLRSFGFRGEALASAASVSRLTLTSRQKADEVASQIQSQFGKLTKIQKVGGNFGTQILVESLFENVPARFKFLKTDGAEVLQITKVIKAMALANPHVAFKMKNHGELKLFYAKSDGFLQRSEQVLGVAKLFQSESNESATKNKVKIIYSSPNDVVNSQQNIWIFVQGRWIQDKSISRALLDAYQNLLMHGEYPYCVVHLECDPQNLDINIHPTKSQVKFQNSSEIFRLVNGTLRRSLEKAPWLEQIFKPEVLISEPLPMVFQSTESMQDSSFDTTFFRQKSNPIESAQILNSVVETSPQQYWGQTQVVGQLNLTYIVTQSRHSVLLIDQHAAHERVMFERLMKSWREKNIEIQNLLIPISVDLEGGAQSLLEISDQLKEIGIVVEQGGPDTLLITAIPSLIQEQAVAEVVHKLHRETLENGQSFAFDKIIGDIFASMACHSVVRAGQSLSTSEMKELLVQMDEHPLSSFCPHGRPVYKEITFRELDRDFGRIV